MIRSLVVVMVCATAAMAAPRKVLVLPIDGNADEATRKRLDGTLGKLATRIDGTVTTGSTSFADTAAAVGCDPGTAKCVEDVVGTLAVDELVWGTATTSATGQTVFVVHRAAAKQPATDSTVVIDNPPDDAKTEAALVTMFPTTTPDPNQPPPQPLPVGPPEDHTRRNMGIALAAGGGVMVIIALTLWANESSTEDEIDNHPINTVKDFHALSDLEDRAIKYAVVGDLLMVAGLAVGGYGGYILYQEHQTKVALQPARVEGGVGVSIGGWW